MVASKLNWKSLFLAQIVWYSNGRPSHVILPFEYGTPILSRIQKNLVFKCPVFRWLLYYFQYVLWLLYQRIWQISSVQDSVTSMESGKNIIFLFKSTVVSSLRLITWSKKARPVYEEARSNSLAHLASSWAVRYKLVGIKVPWT